jgi:hypothetical protein
MLCEYIIGENNTFIPTNKISTIKKLPAGCYTAEWNGRIEKYVFIKRRVNTDKLLMLPNKIFSELLTDIQFFIDNKQKFDKYNFVYKRGILLWGEPGNGKTCLGSLLIEKHI